MPSEFFRTSTTWVVDFRYDGRARRWFVAFGPKVDVEVEMAERLQVLYGDRARLVEVRRATDDEETSYLRGTEPKNVMCPTGRGQGHRET
jgi:hypothetical protein